MENKQYLITERAHLMCPNMNFGIKVVIKAPYEFAKIQATMTKLETAHPFLKSLIARDVSNGKLYYAFHNELHIEILEHNDAKQWETYYKECTNNGWNVFHEPLMKLIVMEGKEQFDCIFIAHHLLGDGRAILGIVNEFADSYVMNKSLKTANEQLITSIKDFPSKSDLPWFSKMIIHHVNKKWEKENQTVSYANYLDFERQFMHNNPVSYTEESLDATKVERLRASCHEEELSLNDYLVAEMMLNEHTNKVIIAADIRKYLSFYQENALGNYATAFSVVCNDKTDNLILKAKTVSKEIKKIRQNPQKLMLVLACYFRMNPDLIDAVAIATLGNDCSKAGNFVGSMMFGYGSRNGYSITNLGNIQNPNIIEGMFIPPASPANKKTMGVLSVNGCMKKCTVEYNKCIKA